MILDFETTGLSKTMHKITEVAAVKVKKGYIIDKFETLVNPECSIPEHITGITGIDDNLVKDSPTLDKVISDLVDFIGDSVIVAHNAEFDYGFLAHNVEKHLNQRINNSKICTRRLAKKLLPDVKRKTLSEVCKFLEVENETAHRAMSDVKATFQVFNKFREIMYDSGIYKTDDLVRFSNS